ncbi:MAG: tetratricopeptide repeat protein [bacterium]
MTFFWFLILSLAGLLVLGILLVTKGMVNEEDPLVREAEEKLKQGSAHEAEPLLRQATQLNPQNAKAQWDLAKVLQRSGQYNQAAEQLEYALSNSLFPSDVDLDDALVRLGQIYEKARNYPRAIDTWSRYLEQYPDSMEAHFRRGRLYYAENKVDRALNDFLSIEDNFDERPDLLALYLGRCYRRIDQYEDAFDYYEDYLQNNPDDYQALLELSDVAQEIGKGDRARSALNQVKDHGDTEQSAEALVRLIRISLEESGLEEADDFISQLKDLNDKKGLTETLNLHRKYLEAKLHEERDNPEEALDLYRSIYMQRPEFKDVEDIIEDKIEQIDPQELLQNFLSMGRDEFVKTSEEIVKIMGFTIVDTDAFGPDEVNITARDDSSGPKISRVLFTFKRWDNTVAEWPLREFELQLLEQRFDRGIFVAPRGFQRSAEEYVEQSPIRLIGPDTLLQYLREVEKKEI